VRIVVLGDRTGGHPHSYRRFALAVEVGGAGRAFSRAESHAPAARNYSLVLRRSQSVTIFVGSTASLSICISTTLPSLSIK